MLQMEHEEQEQHLIAPQRTFVTMKMSSESVIMLSFFKVLQSYLFSVALGYERSRYDSKQKVGAIFCNQVHTSKGSAETL